MKKIFLLNTLLLLTTVNLYSQSGDSCVEAIEITAGTYTVNGINGNSFEANCTESQGTYFDYETAPRPEFPSTTSKTRVVSPLPRSFHPLIK